MQSNVLFLHTGCKNKGHVFSFCLFFAYFIVIFTEVNIFSWYFESKMLILQDFFFAIFFFTGARGAYAYANASTLQHCSFAYNRCLLHVFFFSPPPSQPRWLLKVHKVLDSPCWSGEKLRWERKKAAA